MKKVVITTVLMLAIAGTTNAQGFLNKPILGGKKKTEEPQKEEVVVKKLTLEDKIKADLENPFLDGLEVKQDSRGMSGVYYSNFPVQMEFASSNAEIGTPVAQKFMVTYDESTPNHTLSINSQYAYETTKPELLVKRATWYLTAYNKKVLEKTGVFAAREYDQVPNNQHKYRSHTLQNDLQGNPLPVDPDKDVLVSFATEILEAEPGILLIKSQWVGTDKIKNEFEKVKKRDVILVLYKAEKKAEAEKYTNEVAWDKIVELWAKENNANTATASLPKEHFKDAKLNAEALAFAKDFGAKNHPNEQIQYTYIGSKDWNIIRNKTTGAILKRSLDFVVVVKIGAKCAYEYGSIEQLYDGSSYGKSLWKGQGAPQYIDCAGVNQYKQ